MLSNAYFGIYNEMWIMYAEAINMFGISILCLAIAYELVNDFEVFFVVKGIESERELKKKGADDEYLRFLMKDIYMLIDEDNDKTLYPYEFSELWDAISIQL